ncbi:MAG: zinc ribbon domain-containing protein [Gammaproteobacteria bacterium]
MEFRTLQDIYRCPHCDSITARGDYHCRGCGVRFGKNDIDIMEDNIHSPIGATPWNTRDRYTCVHCDKFVAITDKYCRGCGDEIEDHERQLMRLKLSELAKKNSSSLIGLGIVVLLLIVVSIEMVS